MSLGYVLAGDTLGYLQVLWLTLMTQQTLDTHTAFHSRKASLLNLLPSMSSILPGTPAVGWEGPSRVGLSSPPFLVLDYSHFISSYSYFRDVRFPTSESNHLCCFCFPPGIILFLPDCFPLLPLVFLLHGTSFLRPRKHNI